MADGKLRMQSMDFAVAIINLVKTLKGKRESIISNQIGRSGTSIGANIREAQYAHGKADFMSKLQIALKEAIALVDELVVTAEYDNSKPSAYPHGWLDNSGKNDWEYWKTYIQDKNNTIWVATLNVANTANGEKVLYDISPIKKAGQAVKSATIPTINSIAQNSEKSTGEVEYSISENSLENVDKILYDNSNPLSVVNRAKTTNNSSINWVYKAEIFSTTENKLFHEKISEINQGSEAFEKNSIDEYMLPVENKIVFTNGNYDAPYIREIIEVLTDYQTEFEEIKERIFNVEKGKSSKQDALQTIKEMFGDGIVISYRSGNGGVYGWQDGRRKGKTRRTVVRNYLNKFYGRGNDSQINETEADLKESAFSLSENGESIAPVGNYYTPLNETALAEEDIAPVADNVTPETVDSVDNFEAPFPTDADALLGDGSRSEALLLDSLDNHPIKTVEDRVKEKIRAVEADLTDTKHLRREAEANYKKQIGDIQDKIYSNLIYG